MKEELELNELDLEQLLRSKTWNQLSAAERTAAATIVSGQDEYDRLYAIVHQLKTTTGVHDSDMIPSGDIRENLLMAFDEEQRRKRVLWWSVMGFWLRDKLRLDVPAMRIGLASVVLAAGLFAVWKSTSGEVTPAGIAETKKVPAGDSFNDKGTAARNKIENENLPIIGDSVLYPMWVQPEAVVVDENENDEVIGVQDNLPEQEQLVQSPAVEHPDSAGMITAGGNDSVAFYLPTIGVVPGNVDAVCCGATQVLTNGSYMYNWTSPSYTNATPPTSYDIHVTNANVASIQLTAPNCRSLANDKDVIAAFFSLK
jgi:hypothetical protein